MFQPWERPSVKHKRVPMRLSHALIGRTVSAAGTSAGAPSLGKAEAQRTGNAFASRHTGAASAEARYANSALPAFASLIVVDRKPVMSTGVAASGGSAPTTSRPGLRISLRYGPNAISVSPLATELCTSPPPGTHLIFVFI